MSGEQVKVNLARLDEVVGELAGFGTEIEQQVIAVAGRVVALHARWEGGAAVKHAEAQAEWVKGTQLLSDGIKGLHRVTSEAHRSLAETIVANKARFS